jgi:hypothetical protein
VSWWSVVPNIGLAVAVLMLPGAAVAWASKVRGFALVALAAPITVSLIALAAVCAPLVGLPWSWIVVVLLALAVSVVAFVFSLLLVKHHTARSAPIDWTAGAGYLAAAAIGAFLVGRRIVAAVGTPESFSQTFDNVFHLNAVRYIQDSGSGSSLSLSTFTGGTFYPAAWHDVVALIATMAGAEIPVAVNVVNLVVGALVWPLGCIYLVHTVVGKRVAASITAAIMAAAFGAFPLLLIDFGVLYPNFLGNALLPVALALGLKVLGLAHDTSRSRILDGMILATILAGVALAHPSSAMAFLAFMVAPAAYAWATAFVSMGRRRPLPWLTLAGMLAALTAAVLTLGVAWKQVRPPEEAATWSPIETTGRAIGEVFTSSAIGRPVSWAVMALALTGIVALIVQRSRLWLVGMYVVASMLFVVVASFPLGGLRMFITGVWYNDPARLASLLPSATLPLATIGAVVLWDKWVCPALSRVSARIGASEAAHGWSAPLACRLVGGMAVVGLLTFSTQQANVREAVAAAVPGYQISDSSPLITTDELALIQRLPQEVPEGAIIAGNPWNGSALAYAFTGRNVLQAHMNGVPPDGASQVFDSLNDAETDTSLCPIVERLNVEYVLDFGHSEVHGGDHGYRGLDDLVAEGVATLVDSEGQAALYKVVACG